MKFDEAFSKNFGLNNQEGRPEPQEIQLINFDKRVTLMKKRITAIICILIVTALYLVLDYQRARPIELNYSSTIYSTENMFEKPTIISIRGNQYKSLFRSDILIGKVTVDGDLKYEIKLKREDNRYFEILTNINHEHHSTISRGSIMVSTDFHRVWLQLDDINEKYNLVDGYVSGPAKNIEEAKVVARSIVEGDRKNIREEFNEEVQ